MAVAAFFGLLFTWWRSYCLGKQTRVAEQGLITDRFIKSTEQLGSDNETVRIGAIHSLWRIAVDSPTQSDKIAVLDTTSAFVRSRSKIDSYDDTAISDFHDDDDTAIDESTSILPTSQSVYADTNIIMRLLLDFLSYPSCSNVH